VTVHVNGIPDRKASQSVKSLNNIEGKQTTNVARKWAFRKVIITIVKFNSDPNIARDKCSERWMYCNRAWGGCGLGLHANPWRAEHVVSSNSVMVLRQVHVIGMTHGVLYTKSWKPLGVQDRYCRHCAKYSIVVVVWCRTSKSSTIVTEIKYTATGTLKRT